jgi:glucuronate isomerase
MKLQLDPDRLFPADPETRAIARGLYASVADLPVISPHGHVDPSLLLNDTAFGDPAELFIRYDHYVTRLMHAAGVGFDALGIPDNGSGAAPADPRTVWRTFCEHWHLYAGTASGYWLQNTLATLFCIDEHPDAYNADRLYDRIQAALGTDAFRPRSLFTQFGIEVLATTDDPMDTLATHDALAADPDFHGRVLPTFRPDAYLDPAGPDWEQNVTKLANWSSSPVSSYRGYIDALAARRAHFITHGAVSADHGVLQPRVVDLDESDASALFDRALNGTASDDERSVFAGHMLLQMARMSVEDGLVMTVHAGVLRNHHAPTFARFGADMGHDIPTTTHFAQPLRPLLDKYGDRPDFHLVLFAVDETVYSREIAPLAGVYPSVYIGAPWWFLDAPDAVQRFRASVTETAGFYRGSGFIDDTRAFLSIPARHDMSRRLDAGFLAKLVRAGRLDLATAERIAVDLVDSIPRKVFKL